MEPLFDIQTTVSEQNYRRAMLLSGRSPAHCLRLSAAVIIIAYLIGEFFYYWSSSYYRLSVQYVVIQCILILMFAGLFFYEFKTPKRNSQRNIDHLIMYTGRSCLQTNFKFFDNEFSCKSYDRDGDVHIPYGFITKIADCGDFIMLCTRQNKMALITKSDVPDNKAFSDFIWSKCPNAKFKQY